MLKNIGAYRCYITFLTKRNQRQRWFPGLSLVFFSFSRVGLLLLGPLPAPLVNLWLFKAQLVGNTLQVSFCPNKFLPVASELSVLLLQECCFGWVHSYLGFLAHDAGVRVSHLTIEGLLQLWLYRVKGSDSLDLLGFEVNHELADVVMTNFLELIFRAI